MAMASLEAKEKPRKLARSPCCGKFRCRCYSSLGDPKQSAWWIFLLHTDAWDPSSKRAGPGFFDGAFVFHVRAHALFGILVNTHMREDPDRNLQGLARSGGCDALGRRREVHFLLLTWMAY